tara:strand:+ start:54 stop:281 length:228 start_codon:yes stop_codon:yes gene_type:complete
MEYTVKTFTANIKGQDSASTAAEQLEKMINEMQAEGWAFVSVENITTNIAGESGCFGMGGTPDRLTSFQMVVFQK